MSTDAWRGPLPNPTEEMRPFWEGLAREEFLLLRCQTCGAWRWPLAGCREHPNAPYLANLQWARASGRGRVLAHTVQHVPFDPAVPTPFVYAVIALDEGPVIPGVVVRCDPAAVHAGMAVRVAFRRISEEYALPEFEPIAPGHP